jgi:ADP-dependent NAD(P)H-hydrate dehydratase / NAD(P)H-hydrate epimerase
VHGMDALVCGPGLGLGPAQTDLVHFIVEDTELPVVIDADALTLMTGNLKRFRLARGPRLLLPHHGEVARLLQCTVPDVEHDPLAALLELTELTHSVVVMKGAYTLLGAPGRKPAVLGEPCPALATGGTGDVLAGIVGALLVEHEPFVAALLAVHLHSRAALLWSETTGADRGMFASEVADHVPRAIAELSRPKLALSD